MKQLTLVMGLKAQQDVCDYLRTMPQIQGFTLSHIEGHSEQSETNPFLSARDKVVGYTPHVRIDVVLSAVDIADVLQALKKLRQEGHIKELFYWVAPVDEAGHL
ncbi:DUF3240 family protein [Ghiorsea bivora]|uniref:DUF3240 family protein n=1 Tax=Ghiorsea bivora TaxID=1485545 RepID=UPI000570E2AC|nr:DUF3240 family protein [Ghiorsea bivora]